MEFTLHFKTSNKKCLNASIGIIQFNLKLSNNFSDKYLFKMLLARVLKTKNFFLSGNVPD